MLVGVVSDVHGNRIALDRVLEDMPSVDALVCAGDVVGYGPWPGDCVDAMRERDVPTVCGNHDRAVRTGATFGFNGMAAAGVEYARGELSGDQMDWIADLPEERTEFDGRVKVVHGHPDDPDRYTYPDLYSADMLDEEDVLITGHTHVQAHEEFDEGVVMNPGSVGQPRDRDPRAAYSVLDLDALDVTEHRVEYDVETVQAAVEEAGLPEGIGKRLEKGR